MTKVKLGMDRKTTRSVETEYLDFTSRLIKLTQKSKRVRNFEIKIFPAKEELASVIFRAEHILEETTSTLE